MTYNLTVKDLAQRFGLTPGAFKVWLCQYEKKGAIPKHTKSKTFSKTKGKGLKVYYSEKYYKILKNARDKIPKRQKSLKLANLSVEQTKNRLRIAIEDHFEHLKQEAINKYLNEINWEKL